uniref:Uncharacterized protein n=1 Tax=Caenorhabditis japonica TaxID=281687 RepID=A0A8R1E7P4_CAEJA
MSHRLRESAEYFMKKYGDSWKTEKVVIEKMNALRNYLIDELAKIDKQEAAEQESEQECEEEEEEEEGGASQT